MKVIPVIIVSGFLLFTCSDSDVNKLWVYIDPVQCLQNPWEKEWIIDHNNDFSSWNEMSGKEKLDVFRAFYLDQQILIYDIRQYQLYDGVCAACSCPRGDRIECLINENDLDQMMDSGFKTL